MPAVTATPSRPCAAPDIGCLPPIRIFKAESFRLAALFALVFLALTAVLIGTVLWIVAGAERETLMAANEADIATVMNGMRSEGINEAIEVIQQRLGSPATYMVIEEAGGKVLAGNLPFVTCARDAFMFARPAPAGAHDPQLLLGRCAPLTDNIMLYVGRDTVAMESTRQRILHAFAWLTL